MHIELRERGRLRERDHLQDLGVGGRIILKWNLDTRMGIRRIDLAGSVYSHMAGFL